MNSNPPMPSDAPRDLVRLEEAGKQYGIHPRTLRRYIALGSLPGYRLGPRLLRVSLADVNQLLRLVPNARTGA